MNAYQKAAEQLLRESGCTVRKHRKAMSGTAYTKSKDWGIEAPPPTGPISFGVFAHEVAHQMLHRTGMKPRWREELEAEEYALDQFERFELPGREKYLAKAGRHLAYAFSKAIKKNKNIARAIHEQYPEWWILAVDNDCFGKLKRAVSQ